MADEILPWVGNCISNAKRLILGIFHNVNTEYLQNYLDEFSFKLNNKLSKQTLFKVLLMSAVKCTWY